MATTELPVSLTVDAGIAHLRLNRPDTANAINPELAAAWRDQAARVRADKSVRAVVVSAAGKTFSVGGDLGFMAEAGDHVETGLHALATDLHAGIALLAEADAPVIASVQGMAAGAGMSLVCGADFVIASEHAQFTMAYTNGGLSPDGGATWYLPRLVGIRRATELMIGNPRLDAVKAQEAGLVNRVVPAPDLETETLRWATELAAGPTKAFGAVKRLVRLSATSTLREQLDAEALSISTLAASPDGREGIQAFLAKRRPAFNGRG